MRGGAKTHLLGRGGEELLAAEPERSVVGLEVGCALDEVDHVGEGAEEVREEEVRGGLVEDEEHVGGDNGQPDGLDEAVAVLRREEDGEVEAFGGVERVEVSGGGVQIDTRALAPDLAGLGDVAQRGVEHAEGFLGSEHPTWEEGRRKTGGPGGCSWTRAGPRRCGCAAPPRSARARVCTVPGA